MMEAFTWRRLTESASVEYALDTRGYLVVRGTTSAPPFTTIRARDGHGGFAERPIESLGFVWIHAGGDAWALRTRGEPTTMAHVRARYGELAHEAATARGVDERIVLVTIASEVGNAAPDADGYVKAPRTEPGYPGRTGEGDKGDAARDAEDWRLSRGAHSSHGVMQTLIRTAVGVRPDLFHNVAATALREVLWKPENAIACGVAYMASFPHDVQEDPLAVRVMYGAGSVRPTDANRWGAVIYDELVPLWALAFWNDLGCVIAGDLTPAVPSPLGPRVPWGGVAVACIALSAAASLAAIFFAPPPSSTTPAKLPAKGTA